MKTKKEKLFKAGCTYQLKEKYWYVEDSRNNKYRNDWSNHWVMFAKTNSFLVDETSSIADYEVVVVGENYPVYQEHRKYYKRVK